MKRPRAAIAAALVLGLLFYLYLPLPAPKAPPAAGSDCVMLHLMTNGFHSDLSVPAELLPADHPLRRLFPSAHSLLIGWGEREFYFSDHADIALGVDALIPPSPSVMHVVAGAEAGAAYLGPSEDVPVAVSREGAASLGDFLRQQLTLDGEGRAIIATPGKVIGGSYFLKGRENFHLFNVCNQWMARALRAAGVNINARDKWFGGPLAQAARHAAAPSCPPPSPSAASRPILGL